MPQSTETSWTRCPYCGTRLDPTQTACPHCGAAPPSAVTVVHADVRPSTSDDLAALERELREALAPRLQVVRLLGQGGMGSVFLARDPALRRLVVVKVLSPGLAHDATARARFAREAEVAASVAHPNVVHVYQVGTLDHSGTTYFTMQFVDGPTLEQAYPPGTPVPEPTAKRVVGEIALALAAAHARDLVHRDIKPANVMIDRESGRAIVLDFGISAARGPQGLTGGKATTEGTILGTPAYMSPEQAGGEPAIDRSDVYSLGVLAYELVTGTLPYDAKTPMGLVAAHLTAIPTPLAKLRPDLDPLFASVVDQCLRKDPRDRPTAETVARYLAPATQALIEWPPPGLDQLHRYGWEHLRLLAIAVIIGLVELILFAFQPLTATGAWYDAARGAIIGGQGGEVFGFLLIVLFFSPLFLVLGVLARSWMLAVRLRRGRRAGYPWTVLVDVAFDHGDRTAALWNRQGAFALLTTDQRDRLLRRRRIGLRLTFTALLLGLIGPILWSGGRLPLDPADNFAVISTTGLFIVLLLPLLPLTAAAILGGMERTLVRRTIRQAGALAAEPVVRSELVDAWIRSVGRDRPPPARLPWLPGLLFGLLSVAVALRVLVQVATPLPVYIATSTAFGRGDRTTAEAFLESRQGNLLLTRWWTRAESTLARMRPPATLPADSGVVAARRLLSLALDANAQDAWAVDPAAAAVLRQRYSGMAETGVEDAWWGVPGGHLPRGAAERLLRRVTAPRAALGTTVSRAGELPRGWALAPGVGSLEACSCIALDARQQARLGPVLSAPFTDFDAAFLLALDRQDGLAALDAIRRAAAYDLALLGEPMPPIAATGITGMGRVRRMALRMSQVTGDRAMRDLAVELDWILTARGAVAPARGIAQDKLMADPVRPAGFSALADRSLLPATRVRLLEGVVGGICQNPQEVLFGPSQSRRALLDSAAIAIQDLPRASDLMAWQRRRLARAAQMDQASRKSACTVGEPL